jgi:hypothetical protein
LVLMGLRRIAQHALAPFCPAVMPFARVSMFA